MIKVSVVIGSYNQRDVLKKTLESLFHQTLSPELYEIQLIDSSSFDGTDRMIEEIKPTCRLNYQRVENRGKAAARNLGIKSAKGGIILLTDADMIADGGLLTAHLAAHEKYPAASFEGLTINPEGKPYIKARLNPGQRLGWNYFLTGNLSIKKETIVKAGLFDENFKGYGWEDLELGYRLRQMKVPLYYLPSAINHHDHPVAGAGRLERKFAMGESAGLFYKKHPTLEIKYFLGMNPVAQGIFKLLKTWPALLALFRNKRYLMEEYQYRLGLEKGLKNA